MTDCNKDEEGVEVKNSIFKVNQVELSETWAVAQLFWTSQIWGVQIQSLAILENNVFC